MDGRTTPCAHCGVPLSRRPLLHQLRRAGRSGAPCARPCRRPPARWRRGSRRPLRVAVRRTRAGPGPPPVVEPAPPPAPPPRRRRTPSRCRPSPPPPRRSPGPGPVVGAAVAAGRGARARRLSARSTVRGGGYPSASSTPPSSRRPPPDAPRPRPRASSGPTSVADLAAASTGAHRRTSPVSPRRPRPGHAPAGRRLRRPAGHLRRPEHGRRRRRHLLAYAGDASDMVLTFRLDQPTTLTRVGLINGYARSPSPAATPTTGTTATAGSWRSTGSSTTARRSPSRSPHPGDADRTIAR